MTNLSREKQLLGHVYALHIGDYAFQYVGVTTSTLEHRLRQHKNNAKRRTYRTAVLDWVFDNYSSVRIELIETISGVRDDLMAAESKWIAILGTYSSGYNQTTGGEGAPGLVRTAEHNAKIGEAQRGKPKSPESIAKAVATRAANGGWGLSDESRARISQNLTGRPVSEETRRKLSDRFIGKPLSEETKAKMKAAANSRFRCGECEFQSNPVHVGRHQKKTGHSGRIQL